MKEFKIKVGKNTNLSISAQKHAIKLGYGYLCDYLIIKEAGYLYFHDNGEMSWDKDLFHNSFIRHPYEEISLNDFFSMEKLDVLDEIEVILDGIKEKQKKRKPNLKCDDKEGKFKMCEERYMYQNELMKYDPSTGKEKPYPSHAEQYREYHKVTAWLFNPWTGERRHADDVGTDVKGCLIKM